MGAMRPKLVGLRIIAQVARGEYVAVDDANHGYAVTVRVGQPVGIDELSSEEMCGLLSGAGVRDLTQPARRAA